jgi:hypothetical protein
MNELKITPVSFAMQAGVYLGLLGVVKFLLLAFSLDYPLVGFLYLMVVLLFHIVVYFYARKFKYTVMEGKISFFQAWNLSILIYFFSSILVGAVEFAFYRLINPSYLSNFIPKTVFAIKQFSAQLQDPATNKYLAEIANKIEAAGIPTPIEMVFGHIQNSVFGGMFVSLIIAAFLIRSKNNNTSPANNDTL